MNYSNPAKLVVLACPGGEVFADEVISHLKRVYHRSFENVIAELAKRYNMEDRAVTRQVNFINDALSPPRHFSGNPDQYRSPQFKVSTQFTMFSNGEIKAEILESIRGKDLYIVQDVENHYPVAFNG